MAPDSNVNSVEPEGNDASGGQIIGDNSLLEESPACTSCRKKKSKCSRQQPCSQCVKSGVDCVYDDKRMKGGVKTGVIERLTQRLDTIENMFLGQGMLLQQLIEAKEPSFSAQGRLENNSSESFTEHTERLKSTLCALGLNSTGINTRTGPPTSRLLAKRKRDAEPWASTKRNELATNAAPYHQETLPSAKQLEGILETYFKVIHPWIPVVHPSTFLQRAREVPRSPGVVLILNAIIAVASPYAAGEELASVRQRAAVFRQDVISTALEDGSLEAIQALLLIAFDTIKRGASQSPWSLVAVICRKVEELQLNSEQATEKESLSHYFLTAQPGLEAASAWIEVEERRRVFWGSFLMDRFCCIATGQNPIISSKSIRRRLPCDGCMWELDHAVETSFFKMHEQTQQDVSVVDQESPFPPAYSTAEGPSGVGGLAYTIEATESLHLMTKFHARHDLEIETSSQLSSWLNKFRQLDSRLLQWELCLTHRWREVRVVNGYIDPNLTLAHMTHNAAIIVLHQRLAHPPPQSRAWLSGLVSAASREACMMASIKINKIARRYLDASNGIPPHQFIYCLYIAGQFLLAQATQQSTKPLDELGATIAALHETSGRIDNESPNIDNSEQAENPAAKFASSLIEQRDVPSTKALTTNNKTSDQPSTLRDIQFPPGLIDVPTMLQQFATSPSSGISWLGMNAPEQNTSNLVDENVLALTQSLMPNARMAHNISAYQAMYSNLGGQGEQEFNFIAELQRMGSRVREHNQSTDVETQGAMPSGSEDTM